ncbi:hypothetical protein G6012_09880 [Dietzia schimae]|nr:hypothetical protein [Dietzia kunjamensis subsp. schimae]
MTGAAAYPVIATGTADAQLTAGRPAGPKSGAGRKAARATEQVSLFDAFDGDEPTATPARATHAKPADKFADLGRTPYFKERVKAQQLKPTPAELADVLRAIAANNGRMPIAVLGSTLGLNALQISGTVARIQKVVNVDGMPVLEREDNDVVLAPQILFEQFGL